MTTRREADMSSSKTQEYKEKILEALKSIGSIDWNALGISSYVRKYHKLDAWLQELYDAGVAAGREDANSTICPEDVCCGGSCHVDAPHTSQEVETLSGSVFVVTCVDVDADVNGDFLASLKEYSVARNAVLLVVPQSQYKETLERAIVRYDVTTPRDPEYFEPGAPILVDLERRGMFVVTKDVKLHPYLTVKPLFVNPKIANPVLGLAPLLNHYKSVIIASPKQVLESRPSVKHELPYLMASTGTISFPSYDSSYLQTKQEAIADHDHCFGAVVVEIDEHRFHMRHIRSRDGKTFVDLGTRYGDGLAKVSVAAIVPGDWHSGYTDTGVASVLFDVAEEKEADAVVLHDLNDGHAVNPHQRHQNMTLGHQARIGKLDVSLEIAGIVHDLKEWEKRVNSVFVVRSNHDEFLDRELEYGKYISHPLCSQDLTVVAGALIEESWNSNGGVPYALPVAIRKLAYEKMKIQPLKKTTFLERDVSFYIANIDVSHHGDKLINGRPTSIQNLSVGVPTSVVGHTHAPALFRSTYRVGTSSVLDLDYNKGLCSWLHTFALIYEDGSVQLINIIDGKPWLDFKSSGKQVSIASNYGHLRNFL